jgi:hypothetical protein
LVLIVLGEYQIPDFREATAVAIGLAFGFTAAKLFTNVIMNFAAWPTGTRVTNRTPEVVVFTEAQYLFPRNTNLSPMGEGFIIVKVNGYPEAFLGQLQIFGNKLPGPGNSFLLEVITDTEITQHLEEGKVFAITHRVYIGSTEALLARSQPPARRRLQSQEIWLDLHHAGAGE